MNQYNNYSSRTGTIFLLLNDHYFQQAVLHMFFHNFFLLWVYCADKIFQIIHLLPPNTTPTFVHHVVLIVCQCNSLPHCCYSFFHPCPRQSEKTHKTASRTHSGYRSKTNASESICNGTCMWKGQSLWTLG